MAALTAVLLTVFLVLSMGIAKADQGCEVKYGPDKQYSGYLVRPEGNGPFPGLVVIHEWWGLNANIRSEADKLAKAGYVALAVDLFGRSTTNPEEARKLTQGLDQQKATVQLLAAVDFLRSLSYVRADKVGSIGWCFGGGQSLRLAIVDPRLASAVIYYGQPITDVDQLEKIKAPILGIFGEADQSIPIAKTREFDQALTKAGVRHKIYTYPGAGHAFANPTRSDSYRPEAASDAWNKTLAFLQQNLSAK